MFFITEILCNCHSSKTDALTNARRFIHLSEDHTGFVENAGILHLMVKIIAFTSTLTYSGENRETSVFSSDVTDELHNHNRLPYSGSPKETDLSSLHKGTNKVHNLDTSLKNFRHR